MGALINRLFGIVTSIFAPCVLEQVFLTCLCTLGAAGSSWCLSDVARWWWRGGKVRTAAFIGARASCPASQRTSKQPKGYGTVLQTSACCHHADPMKSRLVYIARNTEPSSMLWKQQPLMMTIETDTRMIGFHMSHGMRLWCGAQ